MKAFKKELTMLGVMIALAVITAILNPSFLGADNLRNNVRHISLISLFACGEAMVIYAIVYATIAFDTGVIDLFNDSALTFLYLLISTPVAIVILFVVYRRLKERRA